MGTHIAGIVRDNAVYQPLSLHWDGTSWRMVRVPIVGVPRFPGQGAGLSAVSAAGGEVWAVGSYAVKVGVQQLEGTGNATQVITRDEPLVLRLQGGHWVRVASPDLGSGTDLVGVSVLGPRDVWVLGWSTKGPVHEGHILHAR